MPCLPGGPSGPVSPSRPAIPWKKLEIRIQMPKTQIVFFINNPLKYSNTTGPGGPKCRNFAAAKCQHRFASKSTWLSRRSGFSQRPRWTLVSLEAFWTRFSVWSPRALSSNRLLRVLSLFAGLARWTVISRRPTGTLVTRNA